MNSESENSGKLRLHREVVRQLTNSQATDVRGGTDSDWGNCDVIGPIQRGGHEGQSGATCTNMGPSCPYETVCAPSCAASCISC